MAGIGALHSRFGSIAWQELLEPSINLARDGFEIDAHLASLIRGREQVLSRLPATKEIFSNSHGLIPAGDRFCQVKLADTLEKIAANGWQEMYTGKWANRFVESVQAEGGMLNHEDLQAYRPTWSETLATELQPGLTVHGLPSPNLGCPIALACLNLVAQSGSAQLGHYTKSSESLRKMLLIESAIPVMAMLDGQRRLAKRLGLAELRLDDFAAPGLGARLWEFLDSKQWGEILEAHSPAPRGSNHSDAIVAIDSKGNAAAILHTINTAGWGTTGLFVDGISIPDSASFQQSAVAHAGPGGRVADFGPP